MKAVIYFSDSKKKRSKEIALTIDGDQFELVPAKKIKRIPIYTFLKLGFITIRDINVRAATPKIDFDKYDEIVLVFPIWAGRMSQYMKSYLKTVPFKGKKVILIATSDSGQKGYMVGLGEVVDPSNDIIDMVMYKKNQLLT